MPGCVQALLESPDMQAADTAGLQLAAALGFAVYGFKEYKKLPLGEQAASGHTTTALYREYQCKPQQVKT